jgi:WD40 repeat protein
MNWSPDGSQIIVPSDYTKLRFYDSHTGELQETLRSFADDPIGWVSWEGRYLAGVIQDHQDSMHWDLRFQIWDFERGEVVYECDIPWYIGLNYHIENDVLEIWGFLISLRRVDLTTGEILFEGVNKLSLDLSPDRMWYLIDDTNFEEGVSVPIKVYATETNELIATLSGHTKIVNTYWNPDSRHFASVGDPGVVIVWEVRYSN